MRINYSPQWGQIAKRRINQAFNQAYQNTVSDQDIERLNKLFSEIQICLHFIVECDSNIHKKKILPQLIRSFEEESGLILMLS
ncbi:MAG: hypothetical protein COB67_12260 [SAR324 cluster bacterium]|uniref:Uncharacterized protein n=1 Tax=SAR324 cluster bacterium TaxID=2024889 RepID=A0A2A4SS21_9DELT|nr:MAG: hypothetical protein COB67_12260 [SAR324 cluster bacterium]